MHEQTWNPERVHKLEMPRNLLPQSMGPGHQRTPAQAAGYRGGGMSRDQELLAAVLVEHSFHHEAPTSRTAELWAVECNCGLVLVAEDLPAAERRFATHQALAIAKAIEKVVNS